MASDSRFLRKGNPCAQCGELIASPLWIERERNRVSVLWSCRACSYQFVTVAVLKSGALAMPVPRARQVRRDKSAIAV